LDGARDAVQDGGGIVEYLTVLEAQSRETSRGEPSIAPLIGERRWKVTVTIGLDDDARFVAEEVDDEGAERLLPAELGADKLATS